MVSAVKGMKHIQNNSKSALFFSSFYGYKKYFSLVLMFLPIALYFIVFHYIPMYGIVLAFKEYNISKGILGSDWIGLTNFRVLMGTSTFTRAVRNTVIISFAKLICGFPMPIILAILLNEIRSLHFKKVVQTVTYLPHFLSWVILAGMFMQFLSPSSGFINHILGWFGVDPIFFLADNRWFRGVIVVTDVWKGMGWGSVVYIATIAGISPELYEAADCDGAGRFQKMLKITLPLLGPTITVLFILSVGNIMNAGFDQIFNMYSASVYESSDIIDTYVYRTGLTSMKYSIATAVGLFKNVIGFVLVMLTNKISNKLSGNGIW